MLWSQSAGSAACWHSNVTLKHSECEPCPPRWRQRSHMPTINTPPPPPCTHTHPLSSCPFLRLTTLSSEQPSHHPVPLRQDHFPTDPLDNCGVAWHPYEFKCKDFSCNAKISGPLTSRYPIFVTEWAPGYPQNNNTPSVPDLYSQRVLDWADAMPGTVQLFPWVWNPGGGKETVNSVHGDYSGNLPTEWGAQYKEWVPKH